MCRNIQLLYKVKPKYLGYGHSNLVCNWAADQWYWVLPIHPPTRLWAWLSSACTMRGLMSLQFLQICVYLPDHSTCFHSISWAIWGYDRYTLLDIHQTCKNFVLDHLFNFSQLPPQLIRSARPDEQLIPTGNARHQHHNRNQRRGKRGGAQARLRLNPHQTVLPSIFFANVRPLLNKLDDLKTWTLTQKRLIDCNLMFFTKT